MTKKNMTGKIIGLADNVAMLFGGLFLLLLPPASVLLGKLGAQIIGALLAVIALWTGYHELTGQGGKVAKLLNSLVDNVLVGMMGLVLVMNQSLFLQVPAWIHLVLGIFLFGWSIITGIVEVM